MDGLVHHKQHRNVSENVQTGGNLLVSTQIIYTIDRYIDIDIYLCLRLSGEDALCRVHILPPRTSDTRPSAYHPPGLFISKYLHYLKYLCTISKISTISTLTVYLVMSSSVSWSMVDTALEVEQAECPVLTVSSLDGIVTNIF